MINAEALLEEINNYRASKGRDPLTPADLAPDPMATAMDTLDLLIREQLLLTDKLFLNASEDPKADKTQIEKLNKQIEEVKDWIVDHPESIWTMEVLEYRIRQVHYK